MPEIHFHPDYDEEGVPLGTPYSGYNIEEGLLELSAIRSAFDRMRLLRHPFTRRLLYDPGDPHGEKHMLDTLHRHGDRTDNERLPFD